jgi:hypothetical protein
MKGLGRGHHWHHDGADDVRHHVNQPTGAQAAEFSRANGWKIPLNPAIIAAPSRGE